MIRLTPEIKEEIKANLERLTGSEITNEDDYLLIMSRALVHLKNMMVQVAEQADEASAAVRRFGASYRDRSNW